MQNKKPPIFWWFLVVEIITHKDNDISENVGINDTKNEEKEIRSAPEVNRVQFPNYFEVPNFKLPETNKNLRNSEFWQRLNMDALQVMACYTYLVSTGQIDPKTGKGLKKRQ